jgi:hypothetical protein
MVVFTGLLAVPAMPRYVRVNTLKISFVEALRSLQEVSHEVHIYFSGHLLLLHSILQGKGISHVPDLLLLAFSSSCVYGLLLYVSD